MSKKVSRICKHCGKNYLSYKDRCSVYCCRECSDEGSRGKRRVIYLCKNCMGCGKEFEVAPSKKHIQCCSHKCAGILKRKTQVGENNPNWKGGKTIINGYRCVRVSPNVYKREHRLVMEYHLGRKLKSWELVHHLDGNRLNNNINNLEIVTHSTHKGLIRCPYCDKNFSLH